MNFSTLFTGRDGIVTKHKENIRRRQERGGSKIYYKKEKHTKTMREHRQYKQKVYNNEINQAGEPTNEPK